MTAPQTQTPNSVPARRLALFLADYAAALLGCGATCIRIEKNVERMAAVMGFDLELAIMPRNIHLSVYDPLTDERYSTIRKIRHSGISFDINTRLSKLSWDVADRKISFADAERAFADILQTPPANPWLVLVLASAANMSFCRLFGGDPTAMLVVFLATLVGYRLKQILLRMHVDVRVVFILAAFASSVFGAGAHIFGWGATPEIAIGTSVLYLIPGIPYINSISDMLEGHYLCAFARFMDAMLLTASLSVGLCGGMLLMGLRWLS